MPRGEGIKKLNSLFDKYIKTLKAPEASVVKVVVEVIEDVLSFAIAKEKISYKPGSKILYIKSAGPLKTEILLHKTEILNHLKGRLGEKNSPQDIH